MGLTGHRRSASTPGRSGTSASGAASRVLHQASIPVPRHRTAPDDGRSQLRGRWRLRKCGGIPLRSIVLWRNPRSYLGIKMREVDNGEQCIEGLYTQRRSTERTGQSQVKGGGNDAANGALAEARNNWPALGYQAAERSAMFEYYYWSSWASRDLPFATAGSSYGCILGRRGQGPKIAGASV
ncbi:hypothetical protein FB451DRAFT_1163812 [Mycena latifolia]|nr:hypothetical protein FB451DRAFT_1163812 [Mycena latifolia]